MVFLRFRPLEIRMYFVASNWMNHSSACSCGLHNNNGVRNRRSQISRSFNLGNWNNVNAFYCRVAFLILSPTTSTSILSLFQLPIDTQCHCARQCAREKRSEKFPDRTKLVRIRLTDQKHKWEREKNVKKICAQKEESDIAIYLSSDSFGARTCETILFFRRFSLNFNLFFFGSFFRFLSALDSQSCLTIHHFIDHNFICFLLVVSLLSTCFVSTHAKTQKRNSKFDRQNVSAFLSFLSSKSIKLTDFGNRISS